jgi:MFS family permease
VFILSQAMLGFVLGTIGNYLGWKVVVVIGGVLILVGMAGALLGGALPVYIITFVALGGANAMTILADPNMSIELAPTKRTSLYLGTTSTALAPFFIAGPLLAGGLAAGIGYEVVFVIAGVLAILGIILALMMPEPRSQAPDHIIETVGQPGVQP